VQYKIIVLRFWELYVLGDEAKTLAYQL